MSFSDKQPDERSMTLFPLRYKADEIEGYPALLHYDKEKEGNINEKELEGICIGRNVCSIESYDTSQAVFYSSTLYRRKTDTVSLYSKGSKVFTGTVEEAKDYLRKIDVKPRTRRQYILITKNGFCSVESHISCAMHIEKEATFFNDEWQKFSYVFTPAKYNKADFPERDKKSFLPIGADRNPPMYVNIAKGRPITQEVIDKLDVEELFSHYKEFFASIAATTSKPVEAAPEEAHTAPAAAPKAAPLEDVDDLPF